MTLKQAQKVYPDAIMARMTHMKFCMSLEQLETTGRNMYGFGPDSQSVVLYKKVGKCVSTVISSREAFIKEIGRAVVCKCSACGLYYLSYRRSGEVHYILAAWCPTCVSLGCASVIVHLETNRNLWLKENILKILVPYKDPERVPSMYDSCQEDFPAQYNMLLPDGKRCSDCVTCNVCCKVFGQKENNTSCQWYPSRYSPIN